MKSKENIERAYAFAHEVATALNAAGVTKNGTIAAVMVICADDENPDDEPVGAALNYDEETGTWGVALEALASHRIVGEEEGRA